MARISKETAKKILGDVPKENQFFSNDGRIIRNLDDFASYLKTVDTSTFKYHVNQEKNDYGKWVLDIVGDTKLSRELMRIKSRETSYKKVIKRINELNELVVGSI